jgi:hypothetical protein
MPYFYPALVPHLKFLCTPDKYQDIIAGISYRHREHNAYDVEYNRIIPLYVYARCPICKTACMETINTYTLVPQAMQFSLNNASVMPKNYPMEYEVPCSHYLGIHRFVNLHDQLPIGAPAFNNISGEVPYITPWFLVDDIESYIVLHALPVCSIENDQFIPKFTYFILTYFNQNPRQILDRHYAAERTIAQNDPEYYPTTILSPGTAQYPLSKADMELLLEAGIKEILLNEDSDETQEHIYDLNLWAQQGKLGWLDFTQ